ncbi:MAG: 1-acyl-sn-glycerol-3-phosphate acyltransferase [Alphaproteobacteria bacterium]|nr:1-acyl-sn-glycerol-3-phosphate acyltransferase [Alphaproteobacteria bacterium]
MSTTSSGLFESIPRELVIRDLLDRSRRRFDQMPDDKLAALLEDAVYNERKRLERDKPEEGEMARLDALTNALVHGERADWTQHGLALVRAWADEIHGRFSHRAYRAATRALPRALTGILTARPGRLPNWGGLESRIKVRGNVEQIAALAEEATLVLAPTHVSNMDSPVIGYALYQAGLPPFVYGAGLNLFTNPVMGWWMSRLGAYTVDRRKRAVLYKDVLKDYSIRCLTTRHHSLFFPGGTRARSGAIETHVKKGLLGTGIVAWQEMLEAKRPDPEVYVVPLTLSFQLVLEGNTLIEDHLAEAGKQRYIITDDEFAQPRKLYQFASRMMELDASIVCHFGDPVDCIGNPVSYDPGERMEQAARRRRYVTDGEGNVERDAQRDMMYTNRLADALVDAYPRYAHAMVTHVAAWTGWKCLEEAVGSTDPFRLIRVPIGKRTFPRHTYLEKLRQVVERVQKGAAEGRWNAELPDTPEGVLSAALDRFSRYHRSHALEARGSSIVVQDPRLCLYYRNRLDYASEALS